MYLDERNAHRQQRVAQGKAGVGKCSGVHQDEFDVARSVLNAIDQFGLSVALLSLKAMAKLIRCCRHGFFDVGQRRGPVDIRLPRA